MSETIERHEFGAEVGRLLDLVVHALYSDREIFLRELVANAADAIDRQPVRSAHPGEPGAAARRLGPHHAGQGGADADDRRSRHRHGPHRA